MMNTTAYHQLAAPLTFEYAVDVGAAGDTGDGDGAGGGEGGTGLAAQFSIAAGDADQCVGAKYGVAWSGTLDVKSNEAGIEEIDLDVFRCPSRMIAEG